MVYSKKHRHSSKCRHSTKKHRHSKKCRHGKKTARRRMHGGYNLSPAPFSLGGSDDTPITNFAFNAANYGSKQVPTATLKGGRRRKSTRYNKKYRGGLGYGAMAKGSLEINAKNSAMANYAPYQSYNEIN
jgi:hypothetical protein